MDGAELDDAQADGAQAAPVRRAPVAQLVRELAARIGGEELVERCLALMAGAPREQHRDVLPWLSGHSWADGEPVRDPAVWRDYWLRTWGARGLLHGWVPARADDAGRAVLRGLQDEHWRPTEMCLKVVTRHEVAGAGDAVAALGTHDLTRVRAQVARALAVVGDAEHAAALQRLRTDPDGAVRRAAARSWESLTVRLDRDLGGG